MSDSEPRGHHRDHETTRERAEGSRAWYADQHKNPLLWIGVLLALAAMMSYLMSGDERLAPGGGGAPVPEAEAAP